MKAISFVASNTVYLAALLRTFWEEPINVIRNRGVVPRSAAKAPMYDVLNTSMPKKKIVVVRRIIGVMIAVKVQPSRLNALLVINTAIIVAMMPVKVVIWFM